MAVDLLEQILPYVKNAILNQRVPLPEWKWKEGDLHGAHATSFREQNWASTQIPFQWVGDKKTHWFRKEIKIPESFAGKNVSAILDLPEALLFVDGKLVQGLDHHHQEVSLLTKARANQIVRIAIRASSGRKRGVNFFNNAALVVLNRTARALYNGLCALRDLDRLMAHGSQESKDIRELIRRTLIFLKYFKPEGEEYPNAIDRAYKFLTTTIETEFKTNVPGIVHLVGHTHIDHAWLWTLDEGIHKAAGVMTNALRVLEEFPEAKFTQSSAFALELVSRSYPDIARQIAQRVIEGRWEILNPMWVEQDCNIPAGESLIRNILYGKRFLKADYGLDSGIAWFPESPGFPSSLPQILAKSGFTSFFCTKLLQNDTTKLPWNSFWWEGNDGTRILSHVPLMGLEAMLQPEDLKKASGNDAEETGRLPVLQAFGHGNVGAGGMSGDQIETARVVKTISGLPASQLSTAKEFFDTLRAQGENLEVLNKELYLQKNRGTYTTQSWIKRDNRRSEQLLREAELLSSLSMVMGKPSHRYASSEIESSWKLLLQNQSHEILSGTAIADVYQNSREDFAELNRIAGKVRDRALQAFLEPSKNKKDIVCTVFNSLEHERSSYVEMTIEGQAKNVRVSDHEGSTVGHQILERGRDHLRVLCYLEAMPPLSSKTFTVHPVPEKPLPLIPWKTSNRIIETPLYKIRMDKKGGLSSIYDKQLRRELVDRGKRANLLQAFQDTVDQCPSWEIDPGFDRHRFDLFKLKSFRFLETGPLRARIRFDYRSDRGSSLTQDMLLYDREKNIDFVTRVQWREQRTLLKAVFPLNIKTNTATCSSQFGYMKRTTKPKEDEDRAKFEVPVQQWVDLSEQKLGVSVLNDSKYGCDIAGNVVRISLIRSPFYPHPNDPWKLNDDKCTDQGEHEFSYSLYPHTGDWKKGRTIQHAASFNTPVRVMTNASGTAIHPAIILSKANIVLSCLKKAEDSEDLILRLYEGFGESTDCSVKFGFTLKSAADCDLMETPLKDLKVAQGRVLLKFKPFEIKTLKLVIRKK